MTEPEKGINTGGVLFLSTALGLIVTGYALGGLWGVGVALLAIPLLYVAYAGVVILLGWLYIDRVYS